MTASINRTRPDLWKDDMVASVRLYNTWFLDAAPQAYRDTRASVVDDVENLFVVTNNMREITPEILLSDPSVLATLRMSTAPPIARDRLMGLAYSTASLIKSLEDGKIPRRMPRSQLLAHLTRVCEVLDELLDRTLFDWLDADEEPSETQRELAAVVVSDRRCGAVSDPIVRNAQEARQIAMMEAWLATQGYRRHQHPPGVAITEMQAGTYSIHQNVPIQNDDGKSVNMPMDIVIQPLAPRSSRMPLLVEAKSAGDFTNTNKRRKEEATKARQLRATYGDNVELILFLCGYFDTGYLGYEAAERIDWVWEHRVEDFSLAGV